MACKFHRIIKARHEAKKHVLKHLWIGSANHQLSSHLLDRIEKSDGTAWCISVPSLDVESICDSEAFSQRPRDQTYRDEIAKLVKSPSDPNQMTGLMSLIESYLICVKDSAVVVENFSRQRKAMEGADHFSQIVFCGDDVYHIIKEEMVGTPLVEAALRESMSHFQLGVFTRSLDLKDNASLGDSELNEIVDQATHVFTTALDSEAYLVWSIKASKTGRA